MQIISPKIGTIAGAMTLTVECKQLIDESTFLVTASIFDTNREWCDRRNCWNKEEFRKLCFECEIPFEAAWQEVSQLPEVEF